MMAEVPPPPPPPYTNGGDYGYSNGSGVPPPPPPPQQAYESVPPPPPPMPAAQQRQQGGASTSGRPAETPEARAVRKKAEEDKRRRDKERHEKERRDKVLKEKAATAKAAAALKGGPGGAPASAALDSRLRRETPFLAHIRFRNELPEIPSDPKMLVTQAQPDALATFFLTSLEREPRRELLLPSDLGIQISLMDADRFQVPAVPPSLDPADAALLQDGEHSKKDSSSSHAGFQKGYAGRVKTAGANWLMKTTYISQDSDTARKPVLGEKRAKAAREGPVEVNDRERQIANIEASFAAAQQPPVHCKDPSLKVKDVWQVFPDLEGWGRKYSLVGFDADPTIEVPAVAALPAPLRRRVAACSVLRGFTWQPEKFMAYLVPRGLEQALADADEQHAQDGTKDTGLPPSALEGDYTWAKEYNYKILPRADGIERTWFIKFNDETKEALYCEAEMQIELKKREGSSARRKRKAAGGEGDGEGEDGDKPTQAAFVIPSKMSLTTREETESELVQRETKAAKLTAIDEAEAYGDE